MVTTGLRGVKRGWFRRGGPVGRYIGLQFAARDDLDLVLPALGNASAFPFVDRLPYDADALGGDSYGAEMGLEVLEVHGSYCPVDWTTLSSTLEDYPGIIGSMPKRPSSTLADRLKAAMSAKGISGPTELGKLLKVNKQTVARWINGEGSKLTPEYLFLCADRLDVAPRWLGTGQGAPQRPVQLTDEENRLLAMFRALEPKQQEAVLRNASDFVEASGKVSVGNPFIGLTEE